MCLIKLPNVIMKNVTESGGCRYLASGYIFYVNDGDYHLQFLIIIITLLTVFSL